MPPDPLNVSSAVNTPAGLAGAGPWLDERALVAAVLVRDRKATAEFVARYSDPVYRYVVQRLAPRRELADDVVQEVFLIALQRLDTFGWQSPVLAWLLGIARHKVEDIYRARLREPSPLIDDDSVATTAEWPAIEEELDRARAADKTRRILAQLPEPYGTALMWRYWEKRSTREIAALTGKTEKAVERLLARARTRFKSLWETGQP
jgi:RNA polymerase sigma-70 factor, ECF subfamily